MSADELTLNENPEVQGIENTELSNQESEQPSNETTDNKDSLSGGGIVSADELPFASDASDCEPADSLTEDVGATPESLSLDIDSKSDRIEQSQTVEAGTDVIEDSKSTAVEPAESDAIESNQQHESPAALKQKHFDELFERLKEFNVSDTPIDVHVISRIRGGLRVSYEDMQLFLPTSHFSLKRNPSEEEMQYVVGTSISVVVHELQEDESQRKTIIVSRKSLLENSFWDTLKVGDIVEGTVSSVASFGVFLDLGGMEGLIHISRLSNMHVPDARTLVKKGQVMKAVVVELDREKNRIALSRKEIEESPWSNIQEQFPIGSQHSGIVRRLTDFGVYVELQQGIDGLLRTNEISWTKRIKRPSEVFKPNMPVNVQVISINEEKQSIGLSVRRTLENPWPTLMDSYPIGKEFEGKVTQVVTQGVIVAISDEVDGFMPKSKMRGLIRNKKIPFESGDDVKVVIEELNPEEESLILAPIIDESMLPPPEPRRQQGRRSEGRSDHGSDGGRPTSDAAFTLLDLLSDQDKKNLMKIGD